MSHVIDYLKGDWKKCKPEERHTIDRILIFGVLANLMALSMLVSNQLFGEDELGLTIVSGIGSVAMLIIAFEAYYSYRVDNIEKMLEKLTKSKQRKKVKSDEQ